MTDVLAMMDDKLTKRKSKPKIIIEQNRKINDSILHDNYFKLEARRKSCEVLFKVSPTVSPAVRRR